MYTSDIDAERKRLLRHTAGCICASLFLAFFGAVYEHFSYGVYSNYMLYAFVPFLTAGLLLLFAAMGHRPLQPRTMFLLYTCAVTLTVGSIAAGIIRITGRNNQLLLIYPVIGGVLAVLTLISHLRTAPEPDDTAPAEQ